MRELQRAAIAAAAALWLGASGGAAAGGDASQEPSPSATAPDGPPSTDCAAAIAERVQARYDRMRDLEARFTQRTTGLLQPSAEIATGVVQLAKPGRMRWSYEAPEPSLVVSDGATLWIFDPAAREVQELEVGEAFLSGAALQFLLGSGRIRDSFTVSIDRCDAPRARLQLRPKTEATYEQLELDVDASSGEVQSTVVVDLFGNRTEVVFAQVSYDREPEASVFRFAPEPGVRVLRLEPPAK